MSVLLIEEDKSIMNFLETYGEIKRDNMEKLFNIKRLNKLIRRGLLIEESNFIKRNNIYEPKFSNMHYAIDLLVKLKEKITYHSLNQYPFLIFIIMNEKPYDIAVIEAGREILYKNLIERSPAENVIAIISEPEQAELLKIDKNMIFCILEPFKLYKHKGEKNYDK